jgi:hypothetical protein
MYVHACCREQQVRSPLDWMLRMWHSCISVVVVNQAKILSVAEDAFWTSQERRGPCTHFLLALPLGRAPRPPLASTTFTGPGAGSPLDDIVFFTAALDGITRLVVCCRHPPWRGHLDMEEDGLKRCLSNLMTVCAGDCSLSWLWATAEGVRWIWCFLPLKRLTRMDMVLSSLEKVNKNLVGLIRMLGDALKSNFDG